MDLSGFLFGNVDEEGVLEEGSVLDKVRTVLFVSIFHLKLTLMLFLAQLWPPVRTRSLSCRV